MTALSNLIEWRIPTRIALYILFAFCFLFIYFIGFVDAGYPNDIVGHIIHKISALQALQIYFVVDIIRRVDILHKISAIELICAIFISLILFISIFQYPECALAIMTIMTAVRLIKVPVINVAALAIAAFSFQYAASFGPLMEFHKAFSYVDAAIVRFGLLVLGFVVDGTGTSIVYPLTQVHLIVGSGCTSSLAAAYSAGPATVYLIYQRARFDAYTLGAMLALFAIIVLINWLRIGLMLESKIALDFWHYGTGMQIISLLNAVAIFGIMHLGIVRSRETKLTAL